MVYEPPVTWDYIRLASAESLQFGSKLTTEEKQSIFQAVALVLRNTRLEHQQNH